VLTDAVADLTVLLILLATRVTADHALTLVPDGGVRSFRPCLHGVR
jgi:hypothetical protein